MEPLPLWMQQARQWSHVRPPLRPGRADLERVQAMVDRRCGSLGRGARVLVLGATPELRGLRWPEGGLVLAVDASRPMLERVWAAGPTTGGEVREAGVQGDWCFLPTASEAWDLVVGDGCYVLMTRASAAALTVSVRRVLRSEGTFIIRVFTRPEVRAEPERVWQQLVEGRIGSFHVFKFRLLMALEHGQGEVRVSAAWEFVRRRWQRLEALARERGWSGEEVRTIEAYAGQSATYWFPTAAEFRGMVGGCFVERGCSWGEYEMGECCGLFELGVRGGSKSGSSRWV